jgi:hypothetical protein
VDAALGRTASIGAHYRADEERTSPALREAVAAC